VGSETLHSHASAKADPRRRGSKCQNGGGATACCSKHLPLGQGHCHSGPEFAGALDVDDLVHAGICVLFEPPAINNPTTSAFFRAMSSSLKGADPRQPSPADWASLDMRRRHKQWKLRHANWLRRCSATYRADVIAQSVLLAPYSGSCMMLDLLTVGLVSASPRSTENDDLTGSRFPIQAETHRDSMLRAHQHARRLSLLCQTLPSASKFVSLLLHRRDDHVVSAESWSSREPRVAIHKASFRADAVVLRPAASRPATAF